MPVSRKLKRIPTRTAAPASCAAEVKPRLTGKQAKRAFATEVDAVDWSVHETADEATSVERLLELTRHDDPDVRIKALRRLCPCRVLCDIEPVWERVYEMTSDPDLGVRKQVLHTLCDGSPAHREHDVLRSVEAFNREPDRDLRRIAHKVLASYRATGRWNIL